MFVTKWNLRGATESRLTVVVEMAAPVLLKAQWANSATLVLDGSGEDFTSAIGCASVGEFATDWAPIASGAIGRDVYVGLRLEAEEEVEDLVLGVVEVQIR